MPNLSRADRLTLAYVAGLVVLALRGMNHPGDVVVPLLLFAAAIVAVAAAAPRHPLASVAHDFFAVASVIVLFEWTGPVLVALRPVTWDAILADVDRRWFGDLATRWSAVLGRPWWLTDAASLAYVAYYLTPFVIAVTLYRAGRRADFDRFVVVVLATLLLTYASYFAMPAAGPRVPGADADRVLGGSAISRGVRALLGVVEGNQLDAFPSGHTTVSLVYLASAWAMLPRWRVPLTAIVVGILFSTVYLSYHYVIDVVVGALVAVSFGTIAAVARRVRAASDLALEATPDATSWSAPRAGGRAMKGVR